MEKAPLGVPFLILGVGADVESSIGQSVYFVESELWGNP